ncbi:MAG: TRAP transporter substrate-binding protein [Actinobacteria bacterium]|nr:TRAP transporter substrate-binding protein [Actinomycetota bacterium]
MKKISGKATGVVSTLIIGLLGFSALPASAQTAIKIAHPNVPDHPMGKAFSYFEELVESRSNGDFTVDVFHSSQFGNFDSVVQGLQTGMLQMGSASTPNLAPFSDDFLIFDMPFLFPSYEEADLITDGPIGREAAQALEQTGIFGLGYIDIGFRHIFNNRKPVENMSDAAGLKIRSTPSGAHIATLSSLGMNPTPISWSEVYTALQQRTVDGIDIDLNLAWFNNFHEVNKNLTLVRSLYSPHLVMISKSFYESLSPSEQIMITEAFAEMKLYQRNLIRQNEEMILEEMEKAGVQIIELSEEERGNWAAASAGVYDQFEDKVGRDLIDRARATMSD